MLAPSTIACPDRSLLDKRFSTSRERDADTERVGMQTPPERASSTGNSHHSRAGPLRTVAMVLTPQRADAGIQARLVTPLQ
jgi:hypothetical protein